MGLFVPVLQIHISSAFKKCFLRKVRSLEDPLLAVVPCEEAEQRDRQALEIYPTLAPLYNLIHFPQPRIRCLPCEIAIMLVRHAETDLFPERRPLT